MRLAFDIFFAIAAWLALIAILLCVVRGCSLVRRGIARLPAERFDRIVRIRHLP